MPPIDSYRLRAACERARNDLLAERGDHGHWEGRLASSALSTATAISALAVVAVARGDGAGGSPVEAHGDLIDRGLLWIARSQNEDGGWGDTDKSLSNIATTMLVRAAIHLAGAADRHAASLAAAERYIETAGGIAGLRRRYGRDKTFAVPILTNCALAGLVSWKQVAPLPFELACLPQSWYRFARLPVVSYAIPALVAVGQVIHARRPTRNPVVRALRAAAIEPSLRVLSRMQPASGGFLEATPLTSFVVMSLAGAGRADHEVVTKGIEFLVASARDDGSWPIDTNLATWVTTLSINALVIAGDDVARLGVTDWLLDCQHRQRHPFTGASPGGWGWSDLPGAVPDADDTPGALLALTHLTELDATSDLGRDNAPAVTHRAKIEDAAEQGIAWLLDLQNGDGGWPTFCRGWGILPFDRSGADLTAHAIRGLAVWRTAFEREPLAGAKDRSARASMPRRIDRAIERGSAYLARTQRADGCWMPLWFGNQHHPEEENPVYGTARVLAAYRDLGRWTDGVAQKAVKWLISVQNADGGWGGGPNQVAHLANHATPRETWCSSVEETALAVEALIGDSTEEAGRAARAGLDWLVRAVETGQHRNCSPIGFYFAKLWYYEQLYPLVFTVAALARAVVEAGGSNAESTARRAMTARLPIDR